MSIIDTVILDSKDRESNSVSSTDFKIRLPFSGEQGNSLRFKRITIPLVMDNITSSTNTIDDFDGGAFSIRTGQYNIGALIDELNATVTGSTWTFEDNSRIKVIKTAGGAFDFSVATEMADILGFTSSPYTLGTSYTAERLANLLPTEYFTLHSDYLQRKQKHNTVHSDNRGGTIMMIPASENLGSIINYEPSNEQAIVKQTQTYNHDIIDIKIKDENNVVIDLQGKPVIIVMDRLR